MELWDPVGRIEAGFEDYHLLDNIDRLEGGIFIMTPKQIEVLSALWARLDLITTTEGY